MTVLLRAPTPANTESSFVLVCGTEIMGGDSLVQLRGYLVDSNVFNWQIVPPQVICRVIVIVFAQGKWNLVLDMCIFTLN